MCFRESVVYSESESTSVPTETVVKRKRLQMFSVQHSFYCNHGGVLLNPYCRDFLRLLESLYHGRGRLTLGPDTHLSLM